MLDSMVTTNQEDLASPSSPGNSNASQDSDDMESTRVFFGPFKTPEKQFAAIAAIPDQPLPTSVHPSPSNTPKQHERRAETGSPQSSNSSDEILDVENLVGLNDEHEPRGEHAGTTPVTKPFLQEEPSSALAQRLLNATDNPSPPPSPSILPASDADEADTENDVEISIPGCSQVLAVSGSSSPFRGAPNETIAPRTSSLLDIDDNASEPDLMTFDSSNGFVEHSLPPLSFPTDSGNTLSPFSIGDHIVQQTVETKGQTAELYQDEKELLIDLREDSECPAADAENIQESRFENNLESIKQTEHLVSDSSSDTHVETMKSLPADSIKEVSHLVQEDSEIAMTPPHTPLRRSSRPRRSITPHGSRLVAEIGHQQSSASNLTPGASMKTQVRKTGKDRTGSSSKYDTEVGSENMLGTVGRTHIEENPAINRRHSRSPIRREFTRELGSLSPTSAGLLASLVPQASASEKSSQNVPESSTGTSATKSSSSSSRPVNISQPLKEPSPDNLFRSSSPQRVLKLSKQQPSTPRSPSKLRLQPVSLDDPGRTPARRIPIEQAIAEGHVTPQKASQLASIATASTSIFTGQRLPVLNTKHKPSDSPARRVFPASSLSSSEECQSILPNPRKDKPRLSGIPSPTKPGISPQKATSTSGTAKLPFPLVSTSQATPKAAQDTSSDKDLHLSNSPDKSSLKQTTSRIPRKKPYSRPNVHSTNSRQKETTNQPVVQATVSKAITDTNVQKSTSSWLKPAMETHTEHSPAPVKAIRVVDSASKSSNNLNRFKPAPFPSSSSEFSDLLTMKAPSNGVPLVSHLKRKRTESKSYDTSLTRRVTPIRQVPNFATTSNGQASALKNNNASTSLKAPTHIPTVRKFRRVMPLEQPTTASNPPANPSEDPSTDPPKSCSNSNSNSNEPDGPRDPDKVEPPTENTLLSQDHESSSPRQETISIEDSSLSLKDSVLLDSINEAAPSTRRTTRLRKPPQPQLDNGTVNQSQTSGNTIRSMQRRRTGVQSRSNQSIINDISGMSMTTLRALTANNTIRNQQYMVARLETEVIRKEGVRPESPVVKIRTVVQREQEEKARQREERAARRARRHDANINDENTSAEDEYDVGCWSPSPSSDYALPENPLGSPGARHRIGAGDEEVYETPVKACEENEKKRRVKWDKGLFTEVFLDEVVLGKRKPPKENIAAKGCLAPTAKIVRLDMLGNLVDGETPLADLSEENIVIKKYVYDDDVEVVQPVVRNTRAKSKSRKSKS